MGTRSLTYVYDKMEPTKALVCMYRQMDGYPTVMGKDLASFLAPMQMRNGISSYDAKNVANGASCLAAQLVAHFKVSIGSFYLYHPASKIDAGQEYVYKIHASDEDIELAIYDVPWKKPLKLMIKGTPAEVLAWIDEHGNGDDES